MNIERVAAAINATHRAEVIKTTDGPTSVQIIHRILPRDKPRLADWLSVLEYVLSRKKGWEDHVCKRYFYQGGKIRYVWNFIIQWRDPAEKGNVLQDVERLLREAAQQSPQVVLHQLENYPLVGAKDSRNTPQGPRNPRAAGPMTGGLSQRGAHKL